MTDPSPSDADETDGTGRPTHIDESGRPRMVDVTAKEATARFAVAEGEIRMRAATLRALLGEGRKGDVLRVAELAGIQAGKRTGELIPLCHILPAVSLGVEVVPDESIPGMRARAVARIQGTTGVEMEALTAVSVALLTVYDMGKSIEKGMQIGEIRLLEKAGGRSGEWKV